VGRGLRHPWIDGLRGFVVQIVWRSWHLVSPCFRVVAAIRILTPFWSVRPTAEPRKPPIGEAKRECSRLGRSPLSRTARSQGASFRLRARNP
jgi:hypothetical protein